MNNLRRAALWALILLAVNGAYLSAFAHASIFYEANVLLHLALGLALAFVAARYVRRYPMECVIFLGAALAALFLVFRGNTYDQRGVLWLHIGLAEVALGIIGWRLVRSGVAVAWLGVLVLLPIAGELWPNAKDRIENPASAPLSMDLEGAGSHSPFAPSSAQTNTGKIIPSNFFMDSAGCGKLSQGYLRAVEKLRASFRFVQQSVLPEVDRIHAGRGWHAAQQVVRRLP